MAITNYQVDAEPRPASYDVKVGKPYSAAVENRNTIVTYNDTRFRIIENYYEDSDGWGVVMETDHMDKISSKNDAHEVFRELLDITEILGTLGYNVVDSDQDVIFWEKEVED